MAYQQQGWAHLPVELLEIILESLTDLSDLYECRRVCSSWHRAATRVIASVPTPLLYLSTPISEEVEDDAEEQAVLVTDYCKKMSTKAYYNITLPNSLTQSNNSFITHRGWFLLSEQKNPENVFLYSPILTETIKLPQLRERNFSYPVQFVTSSAPTDPNCVILACYVSEQGYEFAFCTPGDENWTFVRVSDKEVKTHGIHDMIYYKGDFYAVDRRGFLLRFNLGVLVPRLEAMSARINDWWYNSTVCYLVESPSRELVMVTRHVNDGTYLIKVYKMDWGRCNWERIRKFGDRESIFLARCDSMFVSTDDYRFNCVYFFDDHWADRNAGIHDFGFYNMESETIEHLHMTSSKYLEASFYRWFKGGL